MKISYILQLKDFSIMLCIGLIIGFIYEVLNIFNKIKFNFVLQIISDIIFSIVVTLTFIISVNIINMGQIRFFLCMAYLIGFILERITFGKLFAKSFKFVYTTIVKLVKKLTNSNIGKIIFK